MSEKIDTLTPLGRRVLNEIKGRENGEVVERPQPTVNFDYLRSLGHIAGNPYYEPPEAA